jgi:hypothetical protein
VAGTGPGGAAPDRPAGEGLPVTGAPTARDPRGLEVAGMAAPAVHQLGQRDPEVVVEASELRGGQRPGRPGRVEAGPPAGLVHQQVAQAGDAGLVQQPGLERRPAALGAPPAAAPGRRSRASGPRRSSSGSSSTPPRRRGSLIQSAPPSAKRSANRTQASSSRRLTCRSASMAAVPSSTRRPVMPKRRPQDGTVGVEQEELAPAPGSPDVRGPSARPAAPLPRGRP